MKTTIIRITFLLVCTWLLPASAFAQNNNSNSAAPNRPRIGVVSEYTIRPGMMTAYLEWAKKDAQPLYIKAGIKEAYFFTNLYGPDRNIVTLIEVHDGFAALKARNEAFNKNNSKETLDAWSAKAREFIAHTRVYIVDELAELSWMNPKLKTPPLYYTVVERFIAQQRGRDYEAYLKNDYLPLVRKSDANGIMVSRMRYGGEAGHYFVFIPVNDLADLDGPGKITQMIGAEAFTKMSQKLMGIVQRSENRMLRLRPELCLFPAPDTASK
jgi:hypothetical protein